MKISEANATVAVGVIMSRGSPWARSIAQGLAANGISVHIIDFAASGSSSNYLSADDKFQMDEVAQLTRHCAGVCMLRSRFQGGLRYISCAREVARYGRLHGIDVLLALSASGYATLAHLSGHGRHVAYAMGSDILRTGTMTRVLTRAALRSARLVLANGEYLRAETAKLCGRAQPVAHLIGVDTNRFDLVDKPSGGPVSFFCSRGFHEVYNNEHIIRGLSLLPPAKGAWRMHFASRGPSLTACKALASKLVPKENQGNVIFHEGVSSEKLLSLLRESHAFVSMSRSDGTATSLLEALSCGLYPIVSNIPPNAPWVDVQRGSGRLVEVDDDAGLGDAMRRIAERPEAAAEHRQFNRHLVLSKADAATNMRVLAQLMKDCAR